MERICWRECLDELESHSIMHVSFALKSACVRYLLCTSHIYLLQTTTSQHFGALGGSLRNLSQTESNAADCAESNAAAKNAPN